MKTRSARTAFVTIAAWAIVGTGAAVVQREALAAPTTAQQLPILGVVRDTTGAFLPGGDVAVRVYADSTGGSPLYDSGTQFAGAIVQGVFDITVGDSTPLLLDDDAAYFLELDAGNVEVLGDAAAGRWKFHPGGGSHARGDLEARLDRLETAMGLSISPSVGTRARITVLAPARVAFGDSLRHGLLGIGGFAGETTAYSTTANLLLQPVGVRVSGSVEARLGPFYLPPPSSLVGVINEPPPARFALHMARPNPFRARTEIAYDLPAPAPVHLALYDVRGRCVRRLLFGTVIPAGRQRVSWDARDDSGRRLKPGVYQYRLVAADVRATGRIVLVP